MPVKLCVRFFTFYVARMSLYLSISPVVGTNFKTPKLQRTVRASELSYQSRGDYQADYLTVEHNTVVDLRHQFILLGRETNTGKARQVKSSQV